MGIANRIVDSTIRDPNWANLTYLSHLDVNASVYPWGDDQALYTIEDQKSRIGKKPYRFQFAMRLYNNSAPEMLQIHDLTMRAGQTSKRPTLFLDFDDDPVTFFLQSDIGTINPKTGLITLAPTPAQTGTHNALVRARDVYGLETTQMFKIKVER